MPGKKKGRVRTESMVDRLGKKPLTEGWELLDKGYTLSALRLFECKLLVAPPFEVAVCYDAVSEILEAIGEDEEAGEQLVLAAKKYDMINRPLLSTLMVCRRLAVIDGAAKALGELGSALAAYDAQLHDGARPDRDGPAALVGDGAQAADTAAVVGRMFLLRARLLDKTGDPSGAAAAAATAAALGGPRSFDAQLLRGDLCLAEESLTDEEAERKRLDALECFEAAAKLRPCCAAAHDKTAQTLRELGREGDAFKYVDAALALRATAGRVRDKAFALSALGDDTAALAALDAAIAQPPHDDGDPDAEGNAVAVLCKAKAAILADAGDLGAALAAVDAALAADPGDEEAARMRADIEDAIPPEGLPQPPKTEREWMEEERVRLAEAQQRLVERRTATRGLPAPLSGDTFAGDFANQLDGMERLKLGAGGSFELTFGMESPRSPIRGQLAVAAHGGSVELRFDAAQKMTQQTFTLTVGNRCDVAAGHQGFISPGQQNYVVYFEE